MPKPYTLIAWQQQYRLGAPLKGQKTFWHYAPFYTIFGALDFTILLKSACSFYYSPQLAMFNIRPRFHIYRRLTPALFMLMLLTNVGATQLPVPKSKAAPSSVTCSLIVHKSNAFYVNITTQELDAGKRTFAKMMQVGSRDFSFFCAMLSEKEQKVASELILDIQVLIHKYVGPWLPNVIASIIGNHVAQGTVPPIQVACFYQRIPSNTSVALFQGYNFYSKDNGEVWSIYDRSETNYLCSPFSYSLLLISERQSFYTDNPISEQMLVASIKSACPNLNLDKLTAATFHHTRNRDFSHSDPMIDTRMIKLNNFHKTLRIVAPMEDVGDVNLENMEDVD